MKYLAISNKNWTVFDVFLEKFPKINVSSVRFKSIDISLNCLIISLIKICVWGHFQSRCSIVSSEFPQKVQLGLFIRLILNKKLLVTIILWFIVVWNHLSLVHSVILKGASKMFFHAFSSILYSSFHLILPVGSSLFWFNILYMFCEPFCCLRMVLTGFGIIGPNIVPIIFTFLLF